MGRTPINIAGQRFSNLVALEPTNKRCGSSVVWRCKCDCGQIAMVRSDNLKTGNTKGCGCLSGSWTKHGKTGSRAYSAWCGMHSRCGDLDDLNYGGREIKVCDHWDSFENFFADMGEPQEGYSIDRIDNDGNYEPSNCRWATCKEQARNRRSNIQIRFNNRSLTLSEWSEILGINRSTLRARINRYGWPVIKALTTPARQLHRGQG